jgi:hypothetical protein
MSMLDLVYAVIIENKKMMLFIELEMTGVKNN